MGYTSRQRFLVGVMSSSVSGGPHSWFVLAASCLAIAKGFKSNGNMAPAAALPLEKISCTGPLPIEWLQSYQIRRLAMPAGLATAKIVVVVGHGVGDRDSMPLLAELAELLGGTLGASRPVVMNAWLGLVRLFGYCVLFV